MFERFSRGITTILKGTVRIISSDPSCKDFGFSAKGTYFLLIKSNGETHRTFHVNCQVNHLWTACHRFC